MSPLLSRQSRVATARVSLTLAGICHWSLSANLALNERYAGCATKGKQVARGYPQGLALHTRLVIPAGVEPAFPT